MSKGASGYDLFSVGDYVIHPGKVILVPIGWRFEILQGWEVQIRCRSSFGVKHMVIIPHGLGTIDSDYRGEIYVPLLNLGMADFNISEGDSIAQAIVSRIEYYGSDVFAETDQLSETERGEGGFGSTTRP